MIQIAANAVQKVPIASATAKAPSQTAATPAAIFGSLVQEFGDAFAVPVPAAPIQDAAISPRAGRKDDKNSAPAPSVSQPLIAFVRVVGEAEALPCKTPERAEGSGAQPTSDAAIPSRAGRKDDKSPAPAPGKQPDAVIIAPVQLPLTPQPLISFFKIPETAHGPGAQPTEPLKAAEPAAQEQRIHTDVALQIRLKTPDAIPTASPLPLIMPTAQKAQQATPAKTKLTNDKPAEDNPEPDSATENLKHRVVAASVHVTAQDRQPQQEAALVAPVTPASPHTNTAAPEVDAVRAQAAPTRALPDTPPIAANAHLAEPLPDPKAAAQPLRAVSLEFTPEGVGDIKLRLSERAGEVHISLHSNDAALSGRLHEGVHNLLGSLASAGYDAEAWTGGHQQHAHQRPPDEREQAKRRGSDLGDADEFTDLFTQSNQEAS